MSDFLPTLVSEICAAQGITCTRLSRDWVLRLEKNGCIRFITGYKFGLNPHSVGYLCDDKYALACVLQAAGLPTLTQEIFYQPANREPYARTRHTGPDLVAWAHQHSGDIVLKPNDSSCGLDVTRVTTDAQILAAYQCLSPRYFALNASVYAPLVCEYRVVMLQGCPRLIYAKHAAPGKWRFNLSTGGSASLVTDKKMRLQLEKLATRAATACQLVFGSVDIGQTTTGQLLIVEINSGVMLEYFAAQFPAELSTVRALYAAAIAAMFA